MSGVERIAQEIDEEIGEEIAEDFLLAEGVEPAGGNQVGPVLEFGGIDRRQLEAREARTEHIGPKERFGFIRYRDPREGCLGRFSFQVRKQLIMQLIARRGNAPSAAWRRSRSSGRWPDTSVLSRVARTTWCKS
jgi:hypothetical protein